MPPAEQLDPLLVAERAPVDDEPETEEELAAIKETREYLRAGGKLLAHAEVERLVAERATA